MTREPPSGTQFPRVQRDRCHSAAGGPARRRGARCSSLLAPGTSWPVLIPYLLTGWDPARPLAGGPDRRRRADPRRRRGSSSTPSHASLSEGLGTPAPIAPTEHLVVTGLYRHVRNPMYLAVTATILGQWLLLGRPVLLAYALVFVAITYAFVRGYEEPTLRARYGDEYERYRASRARLVAEAHLEDLTRPAVERRRSRRA